MTRRFTGTVQAGYGVGAAVMSDPAFIARVAHHFTFTPIPGTLNVLLPAPFDPALFTSRFTRDEFGGDIEDHLYAPCLIEGAIPGLVLQTLHPHGRQPAELVELIADRHLRRSLGLVDGSPIGFELLKTS